MQERSSIDPSRSACMIMDYQVDIVAMFASADPGMLERVARVLELARRIGMRVIYVKVAFRSGYPEVSPRNLRFSKIRESGFLAGAGADIHAAVAPTADEITVVKHRVSAFAGTDLDMILRANGIDTLVLCGIATSGVVLSTVRHAADADYELVVLSDCCADRDPQVHAILTERVFPTQATVVTSTQFLGAFDVADR